MFFTSGRIDPGTEHILSPKKVSVRAQETV